MVSLHRTWRKSLFKEKGICATNPAFASNEMPSDAVASTAIQAQSRTSSQATSLHHHLPPVVTVWLVMLPVSLANYCRIGSGHWPEVYDLSHTFFACCASKTTHGHARLRIARVYCQMGPIVLSADLFVLRRTEKEKNLRRKSLGGERAQRGRLPSRCEDNEPVLTGADKVADAASVACCPVEDSQA